MSDHNEKRNTRLTKRIMRRIYFVYALRTALNPLFLKGLIAAVFFWRSTTYISYTNVIANAPQLTDIPRNVEFLRVAFLQADTMAIGLLCGMLALLAWLASDFLPKSRHAF